MLWVYKAEFNSVEKHLQPTPSDRRAWPRQSMNNRPGKNQFTAYALGMIPGQPGLCVRYEGLVSWESTVLRKENIKGEAGTVASLFPAQRAINQCSVTSRCFPHTSCLPRSQPRNKCSGVCHPWDSRTFLALEQSCLTWQALIWQFARAGG